jgi:Domain of unknown function (DUF6265)
MQIALFPATAFALLATIGTVSSQPAAPDGVRAIDGEWVYVEDRTKDRPAEKQSPNTGPRIKMRVEKDAVVLVRSDGEIRMPLDGKPTDVVRSFGTSRYKGEWKDGAYAYESVPVREGAVAAKGLIRWTMRVSAEGMLVSVAVDPPAGAESVCLFRQPKDIPLPKPAKATVNDLAWLAGAWVGSRGEGAATTFEERWSPPLGGSMLAVSRTVSRGKMVGFEFLRVVERDGGLVYVAQPGGRTPTEFTLTEWNKSRAVFENPRHDSPQRIVYELSEKGGLTASIGYMKGGTPRRFEFKPEGR